MQLYFNPECVQSRVCKLCHWPVRIWNGTIFHGRWARQHTREMPLFVGLYTLVSCWSVSSTFRLTTLVLIDLSVEITDKPVAIAMSSFGSPNFIWWCSKSLNFCHQTHKKVWIIWGSYSNFNELIKQSDNAPNSILWQHNRKKNQNSQYKSFSQNGCLISCLKTGLCLTKTLCP